MKVLLTFNFGRQRRCRRKKRRFFKKKLRRSKRDDTDDDDTPNNRQVVFDDDDVSNIKTTTRPTFSPKILGVEGSSPALIRQKECPHPPFCDSENVGLFFLFV